MAKDKQNKNKKFINLVKKTAVVLLAGVIGYSILNGFKSSKDSNVGVTSATNINTSYNQNNNGSFAVNENTKSPIKNCVSTNQMGETVICSSVEDDSWNSSKAMVGLNAATHCISGAGYGRDLIGFNNSINSYQKVIPLADWTFGTTLLNSKVINLDINSDLNENKSLFKSILSEKEFGQLEKYHKYLDKVRDIKQDFAGKDVEDVIALDEAKDGVVVGGLMDSIQEIEIKIYLSRAIATNTSTTIDNFAQFFVAKNSIEFVTINSSFGGNEIVNQEMSLILFSQVINKKFVANCDVALLQNSKDYRDDIFDHIGSEIETNKKEGEELKKRQKEIANFPHNGNDIKNEAEFLIKKEEILKVIDRINNEKLSNPSIEIDVLDIERLKELTYEGYQLVNEFGDEKTKQIDSLIDLNQLLTMQQSIDNMDEKLLSKSVAEILKIISLEVNHNASQYHFNEAMSKIRGDRQELTTLVEAIKNSIKDIDKQIKKANEEKITEGGGQNVPINKQKENVKKDSPNELAIERNDNNVAENKLGNDLDSAATDNQTLMLKVSVTDKKNRISKTRSSEHFGILGKKFSV